MFQVLEIILQFQDRWRLAKNKYQDPQISIAVKIQKYTLREIS